MRLIKETSNSKRITLVWFNQHYADLITELDWRERLIQMYKIITLFFFSTTWFIFRLKTGNHCHRFHVKISSLRELVLLVFSSRVLSVLQYHESRHLRTSKQTKHERYYQRTRKKLCVCGIHRELIELKYQTNTRHDVPTLLIIFCIRRELNRATNFLDKIYFQSRISVQLFNCFCVSQ